MANLINPEVVANNSVYGVRQVQYTVDGVPGRDFVDAVTTAAFIQSTAIEAAASGYVPVVKARQTKINELGEVLAIIAKAEARLKVKGGQSSDSIDIDNGAWVVDVGERYKVPLAIQTVPQINGTVKYYMSRSNVMKAETDVQYHIDKEANNLQQDIVTLQSLITKRDNAYSTAAKVVKKANSAASSTISNIVG